MSGANFSPIAMFATIVGALVVAGILGWIRKPRLIVLMPRMFAYSQLSDRGQLADITVFNRGFKTEEAVELSLNPSLRYEIVGSNSQGATLDKSILSISRVAPGDEVATLLSVEGGKFTRDDIVSCISKESRGNVVDKIDQVPPTGPQRVGLVGWLLMFPLSIYLLVQGFAHIDQLIPSSTKEKPSESKSASLSIDGWSVPKFYKSVGGGIYDDFDSGRIRISLGQVVRKKEVVIVPVKVENKSDTPFTYSIDLSSNNKVDRFASIQSRVSSVLVMPNESSEQNLQIVMTVSPKALSDKQIMVGGFIESMGGGSLKMTRMLVAE